MPKSIERAHAAAAERHRRGRGRGERHGPRHLDLDDTVAAETLGLPIEHVRFSLGRSDFPTAPAHGSQTIMSVGSAERAACIAAQQEGAKRAGADQRSPVFGAALEGVEWNEGRLCRRGDPSPGQPYRDIAASRIEASASTQRDNEVERRYSMLAFGAIFAEVAVDPDVGTIRVRRAVGVCSISRVVNPRLALSQCAGGMIGGIGTALMERTLLDPRDGRPVNAHTADYLVPVNRDVGQLGTSSTRTTRTPIRSPNAPLPADR